MIQMAFKPNKYVRLLERKRMTICIGLLASDGIVIASDAQESDAYLKRSQQKIFPWIGPLTTGANPPPPYMACLFTGAGDAGYIDAFIEEAMRELHHDMNPIQLEDHLRKTVLDFHQKHLFPLAHIQQAPEIEMLIGYYCGFMTRMFVTRGSTLRKASLHCAVGIGASFALSILEGFYGAVNVERAELIAAYVIGATKERVEGCGKYTDIFSLHGPSIVEGIDGGPAHLVPAQYIMTTVQRDTIKRWEESFGKHWGPLQTTLLDNLMDEELAKSKPRLSDSQTLKDQP